MNFSIIFVFILILIIISFFNIFFNTFRNNIIKILFMNSLIENSNNYNYLIENFYKQE